MLDPVGRPPPPVTPFPSKGLAASSLRLEITTQILAAIVLVATLWLGLLASLLAGLLVYELVHLLAPRRSSDLVARRTGKILVVALLATIVIVAIGAGILGLVALLSGGSESLSVLLRKMAEIIETARAHLPAWALSSVPADPDELRTTASTWLREHADQLRSIGQDIWRTLVHILIGMIIGGMIAVSREAGGHEHGPLVRALTDRVRLLGAAFRSVVFAQIRISALNTALTALYLFLIVPWIEVKLPLTKTMVAVTFIAGLLPVIGNLISNTVIVVVSLSVSPLLAVSSLVFLVVIHKLEYFVNARVMGTQIHARAWELLLAMFVMEAIFGIPGVVAAPIYYAYLKNELSAQNLI
ncbi:AI-2E family transporter [Methylobacterium nigriterrae]|uniref:AI-2E family transporter n=1 Tax=Methylobacterium nigriterrae TaxID=3127512 RepID=UPI003013DA7F